MQWLYWKNHQSPNSWRTSTNWSYYFKNGFEELKNKYPNILIGLRQLGLMMGIEMINDSCGPIITKACYDNGILAIYANNDKRVCQLLPPLIIDSKVAGEILRSIDVAHKETAGFLGL